MLEDTRTAGESRGAVLRNRGALLGALLLLFGGPACSTSSSIRGAKTVVVAVKSCPEVTGIVGNPAANWTEALGLDPGDAATMKEAISAATELGKQAAQADTELRSTCSELAAGLGTPITAETGEEACQEASQRVSEAKARLGSEARVKAERLTGCTPGCANPCEPAAPQGPCASSTVKVEVAGSTDSTAAARYQSALEASLPAVLALIEAERDTRALISNASAAIELGLATGKAVSDGDLASAAAAAACMLPPLIQAKQRIASMRKRMRVLREIAADGGLSVPRPVEIEAPPALHTTVGRGAPPVVPSPISRPVRRLLALPDGGLAVQTRNAVLALPSGQVLLDTRGGLQGAQPGPLYCDAGTGQRIACVRVLRFFQSNGQYNGAQLVLFDSTGARAVASVGNRGSLDADGIAFDGSGTLLYAYTLAEQRGNQNVRETHLVRGGQQALLPFIPEHAELEELGGGGRADSPIRFFGFQGKTWLLYRDGRSLLVAPIDRLEAKIQVAERSAYDVRAIAGGDAMLYVFYHEPRSRTLRVARSNDGQSFSDLVLDSRESGWQLEAIPSADGAIAVYYYFRNSYNKGLRALALTNGRLKQPPISIVREDRWNTGWYPYLACDHGRDVWLTYVSNVEADTRVWSHFSAPSQLFDYAVANDGSSDDSYKNWFLQAGAGGWYTFWALRSEAPSAKDVDGAQLRAASYKVDPALLFTANLEARIGPVDLGLSYAQDYLDKAAKKFGDSTGILSGNVKIEDLLPGHDVKAEGAWGRYHGTTTRNVDGGNPEQAALSTNYVDIHLFALNQWRIKYGLGFSKYSLPTPVQAYYAPAGQTHFSFASSALRDVHYNDIDLALGYSKLDYLAKYENHYFGPIADISVEGGITLATFDAITTPVGDVKDELEFHLRGLLELGWLWMDRFRGLAGLGIYVRPRYAIEGARTASFGRPSDRDAKKTDKPDTAATFLLTSIRHGPWLDAGLVW